MVLTTPSPTNRLLPPIRLHCPLINLLLPPSPLLFLQPVLRKTAQLICFIPSPAQEQQPTPSPLIMGLQEHLMQVTTQAQPQAQVKPSPLTQVQPQQL